MSVNDLLVQGAAPLYFLDYFACSKLAVPIAAAVITGVATGCRQARCGLIGGETAEMPGMYAADDYDLAGFAVGAVERQQLLPRVSEVKAGDVLLGLPSSGLHSNGFSLVRKILARAGGPTALHAPAPFASASRHKTLADAFLEPTRIYVESLSPLLGLSDGNAGSAQPQPHAAWKGLRALSHITGGGFTDNIPRILPEHLGANIDVSAWPQPPLFAWLQKIGEVRAAEMCRTFNNGVGMVLVVDSSAVKETIEALKLGGEEHVIQMGSIEEGAGIRYRGFESWALP
ncbi:aminoimidazole ribonucleotide synthetase [Ceraceosorus bombacis]|uniref:Phosphoribosylformylglycinamidine cyclo-ligase n=1 Tax=Ceraceosorus bombacis TaxID=401625 RepID=A0A0P1BIB8_9BASI|nr:aminoimidazole ribonucleotide synthetase [Ceraceosorus bombacis]